MDGKIIIHIACNNPDNGLFDGIATAINFRDIILEHKYMEGCKFTELDNNRFRLSRRIFNYEACREWVGNWCWNAYVMEGHEALILLSYLRQSNNWQLTDSPVGFEKWWDLKLPIGEFKRFYYE